MKRLPYAPLLDAMAARGKSARALGLSGQTQKRYRERGLSAREADHAAIKLGVHPCTVWAEWFDLDPADGVFTRLKLDLVGTRWGA